MRQLSSALIPKVESRQGLAKLQGAYSSLPIPPTTCLRGRTDEAARSVMEMAVRTHPTIFRIARCLCDSGAQRPRAGANPARATARWLINPDRTHIIFAIDAVGYPRTLGEFRQFEGSIEVDLEHPDKSSVAFHALSRSVDVGSRSFDDLVRSDGFLNAALYPRSTFSRKPSRRSTTTRSGCPAIRRCSG